MLAVSNDYLHLLILRLIVQADIVELKYVPLRMTTLHLKQQRLDIEGLHLVVAAGANQDG